MTARPIATTPDKFCHYCKNMLVRNRYDSGRLEPLSEFKKRKYCDRICWVSKETGIDLRRAKNE